MLKTFTLPQNRRVKAAECRICSNFNFQYMVAFVSCFNSQEIAKLQVLEIATIYSIVLQRGKNPLLQ
jgi:hypothetical protein